MASERIIGGSFDRLLLFSRRPFLLFSVMDFYTPYSVETTWEVFLPGRMSFAIGITLGVLALTALLLLGSLFLLIALIPRRKRSVDSAAEV